MYFLGSNGKFIKMYVASVACRTRLTNVRRDFEGEMRLTCSISPLFLMLKCGCPFMKAGVSGREKIMNTADTTHNRQKGEKIEKSGLGYIHFQQKRVKEQLSNNTKNMRIIRIDMCNLLIRLIWFEICRLLAHCKQIVPDWSQLVGEKNCYEIGPF